jgi:DNA-binding NarL/FixJ family response regulator
MVLDEEAHPCLPSLPATRAMRVVESTRLHEPWLDRLRIAEPGIVIVDLRLRPGLGEPMVARLRTALPAAALLIVGVEGAHRPALEALRGGTIGYITRDVSCGRLIMAIEALANGRMFASRPGRAAVLSMLAEDAELP